MNVVGNCFKVEFKLELENNDSIHKINVLELFF